MLSRNHITATFCLDSLSDNQRKIAIEAFSRLGETCHFGRLILASWARDGDGRNLGDQISEICSAPVEQKEIPEEVYKDVGWPDDGTSELVIQVPSKLGRLIHFLAEEDGQDLDEYLIDVIRHYVTAHSASIIELPEDQG